MSCLILIISFSRSQAFKTIRIKKKNTHIMTMPDGILLMDSFYINCAGLYDISVSRLFVCACVSFDTYNCVCRSRMYVCECVIVCSSL